MITNQNEIIATTVALGVLHHDFTMEVLVPLLELEGIEVRFCRVAPVSRRTLDSQNAINGRGDLDAFAADLTQLLTGRPGIEIAVATTRPANLLAAITSWLTINRPVIAEQIAKKTGNRLWWQAAADSDDVRKIEFVEYEAQRQPGISPNVLYINNYGLAARPRRPPPPQEKYSAHRARFTGQFI